MIEIKSDKIKCPGCGRKVFADIYETDDNTLIPTEHGFHVFCTDDLINGEICDLTYEDGIMLQTKVYQWMCFNLRKLPFEPKRLSNI